MVVREYFESDIRFYYAVGAFIIVVYCLAIAGAALLDLAIVDRRLLPLTVGFFMFMFVYFISISIQLLEPDNS
ncbi:hypothetical protein [Natrialba sp. SSL1]|uniref:hypothetical protein n=1 Tax=Natrialba sp. SSL1 TaxID=1869245 RepID=UPI0008F92F4C|nr:hypothetical protein [Natrialba sp. SSL1]OIB57177.1 hypothetical protein BBD46_15720 [Natrialba sp. SSL1]